MNDQSFFTEAEGFPFFGLLVTVVIVLAYSFFKGYQTFWSPLTIIAIIFGYYCCLGPYEAISSGDTYDRLINMRRYYPSSFYGAWLSFASIIFGFILNSRNASSLPRFPAISDDLLFKYGRNTVAIGIIFFSFSTGGNILGLINPLDSDSLQQTGGSFSNYFLLSINFLIPGVTLLFAYWLRTKKQLVWFVGAFLIALGLYTTLGFRYRIVLLIGSLAITYYLFFKRRPNLIIAPFLIIAFISLMGIINITRNYGSGLDTTKLNEKDNESYYKSGLRESLIFQTSGAVIDRVPSQHPYVGFTPIISTVLFPIPQQLYAGKNSAGYIVTMLTSIYGSKNFKGGAFMAYAEHYLSFGWIGIFLWGFLIGWVYKNVWVWVLANLDNPWVITAYSVTVSYLYVILSRGYLPQVTMLFFFSVFPIYYIIRRARKLTLRSQ